jgi:hypothetical protein
MKPIKFSQHAKEQLSYRGATEKEIIETIKTIPWQPAELGRLECRKDFKFERKWNKKYYKTNQKYLKFLWNTDRTDLTDKTDFLTSIISSVQSVRSV